MGPRVLVDARPAVSPHPTGIGLYTRQLLVRLPEEMPEASFVAWHASLRAFLRRGGRGALGVPEAVSPIPSQWLERLSELAELPRIEWLTPLDLVFAPNFVPPPTAVRRLVLTVHDLAFKRFPETAPHATRRWLARLDRYVSRASRVIAVSEATKADLLDLYPVEESRVVVIPHGIDTTAFDPPDQKELSRMRARFGVEGPYLLFLGGIEPRKNLPRLVQAFGRLPAGERPTLVIAGGWVAWNPEGRRALDEALSALPGTIRRRVVLTGYVDGEDRRGLLAGATALAFPSLYEGFGFPVLEAMAAGVPVLTSNVSSLPEVAGDAAVLVDPLDVDAIAGGLDRVMRDRALRAKLVAAGRVRVSRFTWERATRRTAEVLRAAAAPGS